MCANFYHDRTNNKDLFFWGDGPLNLNQIWTLITLLQERLKNVTLFDKIQIAGKPVKKRKENPVGFTGEGKR